MTAPQRLPRGRHHLSRDDVRSVQRARIVTAVVTTMAERGYADTPVSAILSAAGVSRETFYQLFGTKADAFAAALDDTIVGLTEVLEQASSATSGPAELLNAIVRGYLDALAAEPAVARLFLIETYAAGPAAMRARLASQRVIAERIAAEFGLQTPEGRLRCEAFVGTVVAMVTARVVDPGLGALPDLYPALADVAARLLH